ncbi:Uncharacterised protein [Vibrio cholerae]|nr:Uncharacterised protein [Vibrio cholerae]
MTLIPQSRRNNFKNWGRPCAARNVKTTRLPTQTLSWHKICAKKCMR